MEDFEIGRAKICHAHDLLAMAGMRKIAYSVPIVTWNEVSAWNKYCCSARSARICGPEHGEWQANNVDCET